MLQVKNLHIQFKTPLGLFDAVHNISFYVPEGKTLGIVGESGSGKSVTALAIMRLLDEQHSTISGQVIFNDTDLLNLAENEMRSLRGNRIAMIFQEPMTSLNPVVTCGRQVTEAIRLHQKISKGSAKQAVIALFNEVQLPRPESIFDSYPHQLSGGQRQRVMIAMALSCNPDLLIADEPTTALDVSVQKTIIDLLIKIKQERQMSMLFISHDLGVVSQLADEVLVMYRGRKMEQGPARELFTKPQHPYTKALLASRPLPDYQLKKLPVLSDFLHFEPTGAVSSTGITIEDILQRQAITAHEADLHQRALYRQEPLLSVNNLCTWFPVKSRWFSSEKQYIKAVNDITFDVYPGETLGLVGESGSGKTTLGRTILRLIEPTSGQIIFNGADLRQLGSTALRQMRRHMQIIFQDPYSSLNPRFTVGQLLMEPMQVHGLHQNDYLRRQKALELLERVNLQPEHFNRYPHEFSGGQRQRVVIARALAVEPKFIICDESVSALDVSVQAQILNLLRRLQHELGLTYIFISHDLSVIKHISDRIMVINQGRMEEIAPASQLYHHPQAAYTQKLIASIPQINFGASL